MDLAEYWTLMKRRDLIFRSPHLRDTAILRPMSIGGSWEEKAFAEDAAGNYGSIWPPRSYSCTFCNREFRSAQALGGHMNVHRRDRARLKQSISPQNEGIHTHDENQTIPSSFCGLDSNCYYHHHKPDLNLNTSTNPIAPSSIFPLPTSRVSTFSSSQEKLVNEHQKGLVVHPSWSDYSMSARRPFDHSDGPKIKSEKILSGASIYGDYDCDKIKLTVGLTSPTNGYPPKVEWGSVDERVSSKRPKTISTSLSLLLQPRSLISSCPVQSEIMGVKVSSMDDLDLELRLGDTPKVK